MSFIFWLWCRYIFSGTHPTSEQKMSPLLFSVSPWSLHKTYFYDTFMIMNQLLDIDTDFLGFSFICDLFSSIICRFILFVLWLEKKVQEKWFGWPKKKLDRSGKNAFFAYKEGEAIIFILPQYRNKAFFGLVFIPRSLDFGLPFIGKM